MIGRRGPFSLFVFGPEWGAMKTLPRRPASLRAASRKDACPGCRRSKTPFVRTNVPPLRATLWRIATALLSDTSLGLPRVRADARTSEELLRLLEELSRGGFLRVPAHAGKLLEYLPLLGAERSRDLDMDPYELVTVAPTAQRRHSAVAKPAGWPALCC